MPAANALIAMSAEFGGAAALYRPEHFQLCPGQRTTIAFDEFISCPADDVGHLPGRPRHGLWPFVGDTPSPRPRIVIWSSGLGAACK